MRGDAVPNTYKPRNSRPLSAKERTFVREYQIDHNATRAAKRAGYTGSDESLAVTGSRMLRKANVKHILDQAEARRADRLDIQADRVMIELARIAFADITDVIQIKDGDVTVRDTEELTEGQRAAIASIEKTKDGLKVRMHAKAQALESLAKHFGPLIEKQQMDVSLAQRKPLELVIIDPMTPAEAAKLAGETPKEAPPEG